MTINLTNRVLSIAILFLISPVFSMANIGLAVEKDSRVIVYNEMGNMLFYKTGSLGGYTTNTVAIKKNNSTYVYDENNRTLFIK